MKKKTIFGMAACVAVLLVLWILWAYLASPTKIALVNFQDFQVAKMVRSTENAFVKVRPISVDELKRVKKYDAVLVFGMGLRITTEDRAMLQKMADKGVPFYSFATTSPEVNICNLDSLQSSTVEAYLENGGTRCLQIAFEQVYTPIVYIIGFIALWFHMNHGFWSMFQSVGWDSTVWIPRLKKIGCWWVSIVIALFIAQAIVFTVQAHNKFFLRDARLRDQYKEMLVPMYEKDFGPDAAQTIASWPYETFSMQMRQMGEQFSNEQFVAAMAAQNPEFEKQAGLVNRTVALLDILEEGQPKEVNNPMFMGQPQH